MNLAGRALRYWHTLRHLKPVQFYGRARFRFLKARLRSAGVVSRRRKPGFWHAPAMREASMTGPVSFRFLNRVHSLPPTGGWNDAGLEKLWLYNLHYFDDLNARGARDRRAWHQSLLPRWIAENLPTVGNGWEPYPTSLRIVNWIKWALAGEILPDVAPPSLALQARWLALRLEWHLLGNHLFANAKALLFAGLFFEGGEAESWRRTALAIIARELPEQVLLDGGNFERSPMYHAIFLEDILDLVNVAEAFSGLIAGAVVDDWRETACRMLAWMNATAHPDGEISLFNDAAFGIAPPPAQLCAYAERLEITAMAAERGLLLLKDSGYIRLQNDCAVALLDVAPIGPDYLPGHAHADTLSFELSLWGQRVIVNGGTSCYGKGQQRLEERRTRSHSTLEIGDADSSEVWSGFRVARRAYPFALETFVQNDTLGAVCSHDGYRRLAGRPVHRRSWTLRADGFTVEDRVEGGAPRAVARFILHPDVSVVAVDAKNWTLTLSQGRSLRVRVEQGKGRLENAHYASRFGDVRQTRCLAVDLADGRAVTRLDWN